MKKLFKFLRVPVVLAGVLFGQLVALVGCQTVAGVGSDITWSAETTADVMADRASGSVQKNARSSNARWHKSHDH